MGVNRKKGRARRRATLKEVAAEVGVSPATVSNAYNRPDQLSEGLRVKVMEAARRLGYPGPDPTARGLRRGRVGAIGVLYADRLSYAFADPAAVLFFEGVSRVAEEAGLGLRRIAVVTFELAPHPEGGLADLRRQAQTSFRPTRLRLDGYKKALGSAGVRWEDVTVYECPENVPEEGAEAARILLAMDPRPTALLATSDQLAFGVIEAVKDMGLSVPGDVSVVGFDDVPEAADFDPPLTTVHQDHVEKGLLAGKLLVAGLGGGEPEAPNMLPPRLA